MPSYFNLSPGQTQQEDHARQTILDVTKTIVKLNARELDLVAEVIARANMRNLTDIRARV